MKTCKNISKENDTPEAYYTGWKEKKAPPRTFFVPLDGKSV
jgi:hypothetical protein